jgi:hypothetical protein
MMVSVAVPRSAVQHQVELTEWVKLHMYDTTGYWHSKTVCTIIAPSLCVPVLLGLPFLTHNNIVINHTAHTAIDKISSFDLLNPVEPHHRNSLHISCEISFATSKKIVN